MKAQYILEWKLFTHNIKNRVVFGIFIFICLFGAFVVESEFNPLRAIDVESLEAEVEDAEYFLENEDSATNPRMTEMFLTVMAINPPLIDAINEEDWSTVMEEEQNHYQYLVVNRYQYEGGYVDPRLYKYGEPSYIREIRQNYYDEYHAQRYQNYTDEESKLSLSKIEERTVLQAVVRHLQGYLPTIMIIMVILYTIDIFPKDRQHSSITQNVPLSKYKNGWAKSLVILIATTLTLLIGFIVFSILVTIQNGFGSFNLPIPIYGGTSNTFVGTSDIWVSQSIGVFLVQAIVLLYFIFILFIRLISWMNIFVKESFMNLLVLPLVFISSVWHRPGVAYTTTIYNYIPATYFRVGEVLTGQLNFLYLSNTITFGTGLISLALSYVFLEVLILGCLFIIRKRK